MNIAKALLSCFMLAFVTYSANAITANGPRIRYVDDSEKSVTVDEILTSRETNNTECAVRVFSNALRENSAAVSDTTYEGAVETWVRQVFAMPGVLRAVLACPEMQGDPNETIKFMPIEYTFPMGRRIVINYETQPRLLQQRLSLNSKRTPTTIDSPAIGEDAIWINTDPAWYGIMIVQSGALRDFVGPDKNNTISMSYINNNIDSLYPRGANCTSKSAFARDSKAINRAGVAAVGLEAAGEKDSNDYYVAGDVNLQWISYAEIGLDVIITVATMGGGTVLLGATKAARASKTLKNLGKTLRELTKLDTVRDYMRAAKNYETAAEELKQINRITDLAKYRNKAQEVEKLRDTMREMEKIEDVAKYRDASKSFGEINALRHDLRGLRAIKAARRGNVVTRAWRAMRAANRGGKQLSTGAKIARSSMKSGRLRDWLFQSTMRNAGMLAKAEATGGFLYGVVKFGLDLYDYTDNKTDQYTSGIDFKPLLLLSADDLDGQENVVNYGMWLMWAGDALSAADDDAAYLQAMDFASKFHQDLMEIQNDTSSPCNVDIYVVRPIIRNPGDADQALYYLIMNDTPWTTAE